MNKQGYPLKDYIEKMTGDPEYKAGYDEAGELLDAALQIIRLRESQGLTQQELADKTGMSQQTISRLEQANYKRHSLRTLERIAQALDADLVISFRPRHSSI